MRKERLTRVDWLDRHRQLNESIGKRFGSLVLTARHPQASEQRDLRVFARCDCGAEKVVRFKDLLSGNTTTCGTSQHRDMERVKLGESIMGQRFGLFVVVEALAEANSHRHTEVIALCDCGQRRRVTINALQAGAVQSCGGDAHRSVKPQAKRWEVCGSYVTYAVEAIGTDRVKIGRARDLDERMLDIQAMCPVQLVLIATLDSDIERSMHASLDAHRLHGEWFAKNDNVMSLIRERMTEVNVPVELGRPGTPRNGKHRCKACGDLGHHAKTCRKLFNRDEFNDDPTQPTLAAPSQPGSARPSAA